MQQQEAAPIAFSPFVPLSLSAQILAINTSETLDTIAARRQRPGSKATASAIRKPPAAKRPPKARPGEKLDSFILDALRKQGAPVRSADLWRTINDPLISKSMVHDRLVKFAKLRKITGRMVRSSSGPTWEFSSKASQNAG